MRRPTPYASQKLLLTAVAVLLGVLGMHVLSGGTHAPGGGQHSSAPSVAQPAAAAITIGQPVLHDLLDVNVTAVPAVAVAASVDKSDLPSGASDAMVAMCLAVLLGLAVLLRLMTQRRARVPLSCWPPRMTVLRLRQLSRAPPPDLLTRLCVLRT